MNWLARIFYRGRVVRLEGVQKAARLMAEGRLEEAGLVLDKSAPNRYLLDVAVYFFVKGRLSLESGKLRDAEKQLGAAKILGIDGVGLRFSLSVLEARNHRLDSALDAMEIGSEEEIGEDVKGISEMREIISNHKTGKTLKNIQTRADEFAKEKLNIDLYCKNLDQEEALNKLAAYLREQKKGQVLGEEKRYAASAVLGEMEIRLNGAQWLLGLDMRDHLIVLNGLRACPFEEVEKYLNDKTQDLNLFK